MEQSQKGHPPSPLPDAALLDAVPAIAVLLEPDGSVRLANARARSFVGQPVVRLFGDQDAPGLFDASFAGPFDDVLGQAVQGHHWDGEAALLDREGALRPATLSMDPVVEDGVVRAVLLAADEATSRTVAQRRATRLTQLARVTNELLRAPDLDAVTTVVIEHLADVAGATVASLSLVSGDRLVLMGLRGGAEGAAARWSSFPLEDPTPAGDALRARHSLVLTGQAEIRRHYPDLERAAEGERSMVCLPMFVADRPIGVVTMSFPGRRTVDAAELEFLGILADTCAQAVDRLRATAEAADRASKLEFLAEAGAELLSSLDYTATLERVARLAVPWFADWCSIALDQDGELRTLAVAHVDPAKIALAREFQRRYPTDPDAPSGAYHVLRTGVSELTPEITDEMIEAAVVDDEQLAMVHELNLRSALVAPLKTKDRVFGVVTWVAGEGGRRFTEADLAFGEELAGRAAIAIDNAHLHSDLREVTVRLQRAVLPGRLPELPGWRIAASYAPAGSSDAGGDFYDVIPLRRGRVAAFVGDVMGRGLHAAAAMAQVRAAIRAFLAVEDAPGSVLERLDVFFERFALDQLVTLVYAVADPANDELEVINAGHPPPVVRRRDGSTELVGAGGGLLLGAGGGERRVERVRFEAGDSLIAYTDGLVERRAEDIDVGQQRLLAALPMLDGGPGGGADAALARLIEAVRDQTRDDDVAALLLTRT